MPTSCAQSGALHRAGDLDRSQGLRQVPMRRARAPEDGPARRIMPKEVNPFSRGLGMSDRIWQCPTNQKTKTKTKTNTNIKKENLDV